MNRRAVLLGFLVLAAGSWTICPRASAQFTQGPRDNPSAAGIVSGGEAPTPVAPRFSGQSSSSSSPVPQTGGSGTHGFAAFPSGEDMAVSAYWLLSVLGIPALMDETSPAILGDYLRLSPQQAERTRNLRDGFFRDTRSLRYDILRKRIALRELFTDPLTAQSVLVQQQRELSSLWRRLMDAIADRAIEGRQILTREQVEKLEWLPGQTVVP